MIGKMDPFVIISNQGCDHKTKVQNNAGKYPVWNETFELPVGSMMDQIDVFCYDEDMTKNNLIGETSVQLSDLCKDYTVSKWYQIFFKSEVSGEILIESKFFKEKTREA